MRYLRVTQKGRRGHLNFKISEQPVTVGRAEDNRLRLLGKSVSRHHCEIRLYDDVATVLDLDSRNGLTINGKSAHQARLRHGDEIRIGPYRLRYLEKEDDNAKTRLGASAGGTAALADLSSLDESWIEDDPLLTEDFAASQRRS